MTDSNKNSDAPAGPSTTESGSESRPLLVDKRAGSGNKDVPPKPAHNPILDLPTDYSKNRNRLANVRWKRGEDPRDDLAVGSVGARTLSPEEAQLTTGYVDYDLEVLEHPHPENVDPYEGIHGSRTGIKCWSCPAGEYLIIAERTSQEVGDTLDEVTWARKMNRPVDPLKVPDVLKLFCPQCKSVMEMRKEIVLELRAKAVDAGAGA